MTPREEASVAMTRLFTECETLGASDIHLCDGEPARLRVQGRLSAPAGEPPAAPGLVAEVARILAEESSAPGADALALLASGRAVDGAATSPGGHRYRFNVFMEGGRPAVALRRLDDHFRSLEELGLPPQLDSFCDLPDGLVVVSGPTGSGKSTTLATLIDRINRTRDGHVVTIEDPVEYLHRNARCLVRQRQVGRDAASFHSALVEALRQDPDVILVGEIREIETIRVALVAAETGHLVFTTLHAGDCVGAIERLVAVFPAEEQPGIRRQLSLVLRGVFAQHLVPSIAAPGAPPSRVACGELLLVNPAVANLVANGRGAQIYSAMELGTASGMRTLEQDLARLVIDGRIDERTAFAFARFPEVLRDRLRRDRHQPSARADFW